MNLPKLTAEQSLGAAQKIYINKIFHNTSNQMGVTTMMDDPRTRDLGDLQKRSANQITGGRCYLRSNCEGRLYQTGFTLLECCANRPEGSYGIPRTNGNGFDCFNCAILAIRPEEDLILDI